MNDRGDELISRDAYLLELDTDEAIPVSGKHKEALKTALDVRKFEIELYWKRATYFWTFIAAVFVAFGAIWTRGDGGSASYGLQEILAGLGLVFSTAWWFVNKGSRFWQKNWEAM
jgi:hypothetical protein